MTLIHFVMRIIIIPSRSKHCFQHRHIDHSLVLMYTHSFCTGRSHPAVAYLFPKHISCTTTPLPIVPVPIRFLWQSLFPCLRVWCTFVLLPWLPRKIL